MVDYLRKASKYLIVLCLLYVAVIAIMYYTGTLGEPKAETLIKTLELQLLGTLKGRRMILVVFALALAYPFFGFSKRKVAANLEKHSTQIENAFIACGFKVVSKGEGVWQFKAEGVWNRLKLLYEDMVVVSETESGIEIKGNRRAVANIIFKLTGYLAHLRE